MYEKAYQKNLIFAFFTLDLIEGVQTHWLSDKQALVKAIYLRQRLSR